MIEPFLRLALQDGLEVILLVDGDSLTSDHLPTNVLEQYSGQPVLLKLSFNDLHVVRGMETEFFEDRFEATLGFDQLYRCVIPYESIFQFAFVNPQYAPSSSPLLSEEEQVDDETDEAPPPGLRLVP